MSKPKTWVGRISLGRNPDGTQRLHWVGRYTTKRERDQAVALAWVQKPWETEPATATITCEQWADRYLARMRRMVDQRERKASSLDTATSQLKAFRRRFGPDPLTAITPVDAEDWANTVPGSALPQVVALFNYAKKMRVVDHNPFDGLGAKRSRGRADQAPPTLEQLQQLRDACTVLGDYAPRMRDLMDFAALTLMRPSELYELRHTDINLALNRIQVDRRLYRQTVDTPKGGVKTIALVPPAREILLRQPTRALELVFVGKRGQRLASQTLSEYWRLVNARAGLGFDFYIATKHLGVHDLYKLGLSKRAIAAQAGWSERDVDAMLDVYAHADLVALAEVDALYADKRDANVTQITRDPASHRDTD